MSASKEPSAPFTSDHLEAGSLGPQICASCSTLRQSLGLLGLRTTVIASLATLASPYLTPDFLQAATSSGSISRDASLMSVSPAQNFSKPPPVPDWPTVTSTPGFCVLNSS